VKTNNRPLVHRQTPFLPAVLLVLALLLQACGGGTATPPVQPTNPPAQPTAAPAQPTTAPALPSATTAAAQPTQPAAATATSAAAAPAARNGTLRVAMQPLVQIDPALISSDPEVFFANHVYDYLVDVTPQNTIAPRLATSWKISDDGLTYVFTLAQGVTFHDGSPLTAADVVWTFNRLKDPNLGSPTVDLYSNITDIKATGDLEVTFTLKNPNPFFLYDLSDNHALILKADTTDFSKFNGTGPFVITNYSPEDRMEMKANENYFVQGEPKLAGLDLIFFNDQSAQVDALRGGQVDLVMALGTDLFTSLKGDNNLNLLQVPTNQFDLVRLRADEKPGNDPRVIQAFKLATDRQAVFQLVQQGFGKIGRDSPIGPLYTQYYSEDTPLPARDVAKAKDLLAQAGYPNGLKIDMHVPDTGDRPKLAVVLKDQWAEAGIDVNVIQEPESVYYGDNGWLAVDLGITGWGSRPYPQFYLDVMLKTGAKWNESHWSDPEFDKLATLAGTTMNEAERVQAYKDIQRILIERGPIIIPYFYTQLAAISNKFQGFELKSFSGRSDVRTVSVAQ
jgi:peptide/nickel transport system substrate-binding protein